MDKKLAGQVRGAILQTYKSRCFREKEGACVQRFENAPAADAISAAIARMQIQAIYAVTVEGKKTPSQSRRPPSYRPSSRKERAHEPRAQATNKNNGVPFRRTWSAVSICIKILRRVFACGYFMWIFFELFRPYLRQYFIALFLHNVFCARLQSKPQKRLCVRRPQIKPEIRILHA